MAYLTFDQMYDHIKKFHVNDLLSGLSHLEEQEQDQEEQKIEDATSSLDTDVEMEDSLDKIEKSPEIDPMSKIIARRKNYAEILRKHFYGKKSVKDIITEKQHSEGGPLSLKDLLLPSTSAAPPVVSKTTTPTPVSEDSDAEDDKVVILQISQMENLLTNNLLQLYEEEAEEMAARPASPKLFSSRNSIDEEATKIHQEDLKITGMTEGEGSEEMPKVRMREAAIDKDKHDEIMEEEFPYSINVSGVHPKYKHRKLSKLDADKIRKQKVVTLSSMPTLKKDEYGPSTSQVRGVYIPKVKKEVEYDSEEECYFYVESDPQRKDPDQEKRNEQIRAVLDNKFGDVSVSRRVDPYFEYLWKQSFDVKDHLWDNSDATEVFKAHAWSNPRFEN
ncbi:Hypothetical predicted protein [Mytilus galloprovincialis]|uniref:Uncharacterized protein n=1 Tax=Mytilus galloprovincialis TaxID=29158 RepID=A0A8B6BTD8_MYTGA|nr:Hypothetical predicted protein [Mytilus galloprovincialis]